ncbi:hypothetical protein RRG08_037914 [Elysia crispata]|uniref:Uncharacterized protein n=1 Tax=Elysia crispata TaxID=231223 RepID=A0AAE1DIJ7_9GAST|nr:hypothetical protein RRG08_037914 [Elysia crispata]
MKRVSCELALAYAVQQSAEDLATPAERRAAGCLSTQTVKFSRSGELHAGSLNGWRGVNQTPRASERNLKAAPRFS